jgi:hypothetical protein
MYFPTVIPFLVVNPDFARKIRAKHAVLDPEVVSCFGIRYGILKLSRTY